MAKRAEPFGSRLLNGMLFAVLAAVITLSVLSQANPARKTPTRDYGFYAYIGSRILEGKLPYQDAWESKPPAIFYLNAAALWLGRGTRWGIWTAEILSLLAAIWISYSLMRRLWGTWAALFGLLAWTSGMYFSLLGGNFTEEYAIPLHFLAIALFSVLARNPRKHVLNFLLGVIFGVCLLFRPNNAVTEAAILLVLPLTRIAERDGRGLVAQLGWIAAGTLLPLAATGIYFGAHGLFQELLDASLLYNLVYSQTELSATSPLLFGPRALGPAVWIGMAGYLAAALKLWRPSKNPWLHVLLLIGWPMVIFLSDPAKRNYVHYYMNWLPFLGLLSALAFRFVQENLFTMSVTSSPAFRMAGIGAALAASLIFFFMQGMGEDYQKAIERAQAQPGGEIRSPLAIYVNEHTQPGEMVLFWGAYPGENFMAKRASPSGVLFYPLYVKSDIASQLERRFLQELQTNRPVLIVDMGDEWTLSLNPVKREERRAAGLGWSYLPENVDQVFAFVDENYTLEKTFRGFDIYRLKEAAQ